jgi:hypothetical protein
MNEKNKLPRGIRNFNPFNLKELPADKTKWLGERATDDDPIFEEFQTMEHGIRAGLMVLRKYILVYKLNTIPAILHRFAPTSENKTDKYIEFVSKRSGIKTDEKMTFHQDYIFPLAEAICFYENGGSYVTYEQIEKAWGML